MAVSTSFANETCPRCRAGFECRAGSPSPCDCMSIALSRPALDHLAEQYDGCLCLRCLQEIGESVAGER